MAEGYEAYHVPQQSRRDKLRVVVQNHHLDEPSTTSSTLQGCAGLLPLYDPSLLPSDLLTCATNNHHHPHHPLGGGAAAGGEASKANHHQHQENPDCVVKEEGVNLMMGYHPYLIPQSSIQINPSSIQEINNHQYLYTSQNLRDFDQSFNGGGGGGGEVVVYKPEPLSLSLSSHHTQQQPTNLPLELNLQRYESAMVVTGGYVIPTTVCGGGGSSSTSNDVSRSPVPLGPFTGYASILKGSRFLKPAQQLLEEFCDVGRGIYIENVAADSSLMDPCIDSFGRIDDSLSCGGDGGEHRGKKSRLISMLDEVFRRYKQYYQQMQAVVASFESVAGLSNAAPFANLALKAMSKHFRCLKNAITEQLQFTSKIQSHGSQGKDEAPQLGTSDRGFYGQRTGQGSGFLEHQPVWRPQRGLPERAVTVLRAWLFEHFLHPYPTDTDKLMLAKQTGLSRNQVSNWFINARVRLWKPMVEEIHMLETRQGQKTSQREERNANRPGDPSSSANPLASENPSTSSQRFHDTPSKRTRNELPDIPLASEDPMNLSYSHHLPGHPNVGVGVSTAAGSSAVSLTLGLHQNNGIGLSEPFPINAAQRFGLGLDATSDAYIMSGFEVQNRHFGRDVIGGQLLHDFVG